MTSPTLPLTRTVRALLPACLGLWLLAGCTQPLDEVRTLDDVAISEDAPRETLRAAPPVQDVGQTEVQRGGLLALLGVTASAPGTINGDPQSGAGILSDGSSVADVPPGAPLAFGAVGRVCDLPRRDRGTRVERFPDSWMGTGYALYDTAPGSTSARAFYITGFSDGCARQVTAANVVFGAPSLHEQLRYGLPADTLPFSRTDEAYKTLKARICGVARSAPCGARIDRLERNTVFVTMYESFSGNRNWSNLLLHDGAIFAADYEGSG